MKGLEAIAINNYAVELVPLPTIIEQSSNLTFYLSGKTKILKVDAVS
ncbi:hypothetical protein IQ238_17500 [Pleurocapsales cyanobacterium LEGE 06147]|nr:hypothetical protein [Pleurocapsales cyanobacterium LEGE 06147]